MCACALVVHSCACVFGMASPSLPGWIMHCSGALWLHVHLGWGNRAISTLLNCMHTDSIDDDLLPCARQQHVSSTCSIYLLALPVSGHKLASTIPNWSGWPQSVSTIPGSLGHIMNQLEPIRLQSALQFICWTPVNTADHVATSLLQLYTAAESTSEGGIGEWASEEARK